MGLIRSIRGATPRVDPSAYVAETAVLTGDVTIGPGASVWYGVVMRGDTAPIVIGARSNVQDNVVVHADPGAPTTIGEDVTIGHAAIIHGTTVGNGTLIGMGAILLSHCSVGAQALVAAGSLIPERMTIESGQLAMGSPARPRRALADAERAALLEPARHYFELSREYLRASAGEEG
jgi:carbonic anhydrase/acetyltransferase-like protein (isoleucine patch superfamily)